MRLTVSMQDPTFLGTTYLYEAILSAAQSASNWRGFYAFATRDGVDQLIEDNVVHNLMDRGGHIDIVVGLDAITNRPTLERLQELERRHPNFAPKVFWNESSGLFHPKISDFDLNNGGRILIVGSGNLTPGGLRTNFEAYTVVIADQREEIDLQSLADFTQRHSDRIRSIDDDALARAARNVSRPIARPRTPPHARPARAPVTPPPAFGRILLVQVPKAGDRWAQVHFNAEVIQTYFRLTRIRTQRLYLSRVLPDSSRADVEIRPCIYSQSNKNYKIEIGAAKHLHYPPRDQRPLILFYERQLRTYAYFLLMPNDNGYGPMLRLSNRLPSPGRGLRRAVTDIPTLSRAWPDCPVLHIPPDDDQAI